MDPHPLFREFIKAGFPKASKKLKSQEREKKCRAENRTRNA
jgi:hypothetical protein